MEAPRKLCEDRPANPYGMGRGRGRARGWVTKKATTNNGRPAGLQNGDNAQPAQAKTNGHTHHPPTSHGMNKPSKAQPRKSMAVDSACQAQAQSADQRDNGQTCPPDASRCQKKLAKKQQQRKSTSEGLDGTTQKAVTAKASHESDAQTTQAHIAMGQTMPQAADGQLSNGHAYQPGFLQDQKSQPKPEENVSTSADVHHNAVTAQPKVKSDAPKSQTDSAVSQSHQGADSPCSNGHAYQTGALCKKPPSSTPRRKSSSEGQSVTQQSAESAKYNRENGGQRRRANSDKSQSASQYRYYSKRQSREQPKQCGMTNTAPLQGPTAADSSVSCQPPLSLNIEALSQSTNWDTLNKVQKASMIHVFLRNQMEQMGIVEQHQHMSAQCDNYASQPPAAHASPHDAGSQEPGPLQMHELLPLTLLPQSRFDVSPPHDQYNTEYQQEEQQLQLMPQQQQYVQPSAQHCFQLPPTVMLPPDQEFPGPMPQSPNQAAGAHPNPQPFVPHPVPLMYQVPPPPMMFWRPPPHMVPVFNPRVPPPAIPAPRFPPGVNGNYQHFPPLAFIPFHPPPMFPIQEAPALPESTM